MYPPPPIPSRAAASLAALCLVAGVAAAARPVWRAGRAAAEAFTARRAWDRYRAHGGASPVVPGMAAAPAAWLRVPGIGLSTLVRRGAAAADLLRSPCVVLEATGVTVVAAHRDKHFRALRRVRGGERVQWEAPDGTRQVYRIVDTEVLSPDRVAARLAEQDANGPWLVLMTCHPFRYIGPAPNRFLAWAREESRAVGEAASDSHRPASSALPLPEAEASEELPRERGTPTRPPIACISSRPEYRLPVSAEALDAVQRRRRKPEALRGLQAAFPSVAA